MEPKPTPTPLPYCEVRVVGADGNLLQCYTYDQARANGIEVPSQKPSFESVSNVNVDALFHLIGLGAIGFLIWIAVNWGRFGKSILGSNK